MTRLRRSSTRLVVLQALDNFMQSFDIGNFSAFAGCLGIQHRVAALNGSSADPLA